MKLNCIKFYSRLKRDGINSGAIRKALQLFFMDAASQRDLLATESISNKLNDPTAKLFLQFLDFILPFFNNLNREMQAEKPKLHLLYRNICNILRTIFDCFIKRTYLLTISLNNAEYNNPRNYIFTI